MPEIVANCPRCRCQRITFTISAACVMEQNEPQRRYEVFAVCRNCSRSTIFVLREKMEHLRHVQQTGLLQIKEALNIYVNIEGHVSLKDVAGAKAPEYLPPDIEAAFNEGATCIAVGCVNAAGTMFRLCVDLATRSMLPKDEQPGLNARVRRDLGLRLPWLFDNGILPEALRELSSCIKDDGNDGAHTGKLTEDDAADLLDFSEALLERLYTEPERLRLAKVRRDARRGEA